MGTRMNILVVDDNGANRRLLSAFLTGSGFATGLADNGNDAVRAVAAGGYDLVVMDLHMPDLDGLDATRLIRALPGAAGRLPIVGVTADIRLEAREACLAAGMDWVMTKPIDFDVFLATVRRLATGGRPVALQEPCAPCGAEDQPDRQRRYGAC